SGAGGVSAVGGQLTMNGTYSATGPVTINGIATFNVPATFSSLSLQAGALDGSGNIIVSGATSWTGGNMVGSGSTTFNGPVTLATPALVNRVINNNATATWSGGDMQGADGSWNNQSGSLFDMQSNARWFVSGGAPPAFNNLTGATFRKSAGAGTSRIDWAFN